MKRLEWDGLYSESWGADLVPEAYAHPAKYSRGLIRQIYAYMLAEGMIAPGDVIGDPFGGQAGGALDAMRLGLHWRGVELEPRFVELGNANIALWNGRYSPHFAQWGTAALVQGDSRNFAEIVGGLAGCVTSPPYASGTLGAGDGPNSSGERHGRESATETAYKAGNKYGSTAGNLDSLPTGSLGSVISSPPYGDTIERGDGPGVRWDADGHPGNPDKVSSAASYGRSPGQVGRLDAVVTSSPFEASLTAGISKNHLQPREGDVRKYERTMTVDDSYGDTPGNIGNDTGDTFWAASRTILEQVYTAVKPGGYCAYVCGDFVRRGQRVRFGEQWLALCEAVGFEPVAWAVAWKTEHHGTQTSLFGDVEKRTDRVSFFRRLANERNPDAAVLNEDVIFVRRPLG